MQDRIKIICRDDGVADFGLKACVSEVWRRNFLMINLNTRDSAVTIRGCRSFNFNNF
jgi:hypothetical protein